MKTPYKPSRLAGHIHNGIAVFAGAIGAGLTGVVALADSGTRNAYTGIRNTLTDAGDAVVNAYKNVKQAVQDRVFKPAAESCPAGETCEASATTSTPPPNPPPVTAVPAGAPA